MTNTTPAVTVETRTIDGVEMVVHSASCRHCGEQIARSTGRGMRTWRHVATFEVRCSGGEQVAEV